MKLNIYSIYDTAAAAYMRPFFLQSDAQAKRAFSDIATDAEHAVGQHPEDYFLVRIGVFDDATGKLVPEDVESLATGLEMVAAARNVDPAAMDMFKHNVEEH
mgnify:CR=1 FL=1